jgi:hypothetical protein
VIRTRRETWEWERDGKRTARTMGIASLGGATLDNEENHLIKKLLTGLGVGPGGVPGPREHPRAPLSPTWRCRGPRNAGSVSAPRPGRRGAGARCCGPPAH